MRFETLLPLPIVVGAALLGAAVFVGDLAAGAPPAPAGGSISPVPLVGTAGYSIRLSGRNMTQQTSRAASSPPLLLSPPLVGGLEIVRTLHLDLGIGGLLV